MMKMMMMVVMIMKALTPLMYECVSVRNDENCDDDIDKFNGPFKVCFLCAINIVYYDN